MAIHSTRSLRLFFALPALGYFLTVSGCSAGGDAPPAPPTGTGGAYSSSGDASPSTGGFPSSGGSASTGGAASAGGSASGGVPSSGGSVGTGGVSTGSGGTATGGQTGTSPVPDFTLQVDTPGAGSTVSGTVVVSGWAPGFKNVEAWDPTHQNPPLG